MLERKPKPSELIYSMEPADQAFTASLFKWDPRGLVLSSSAPAVVQVPQPPPAMRQQWEQLGGLEEMFSLYGIRYFTAAKIAELGFTARTLVNMTDQELDDMMTSISHLFRWDLLVGERYGIKAAVRAERRRLLLHDPEQPEHQDSLFLLRRRSSDTNTNMNNNFDALSHSQEGFSEEAVQQDKESRGVMRKKHRRSSKGSHRKSVEDEEEDEEDDEEEPRGAIISHNKIIMGSERQREHPFIVTEPGEVPRGKKNGLDYLFSLYDQCRDFLIQVQNIAKERGDKCPTKVTNEVFRYAKKAGAAHINKPKMRHYVHCYALHCLDHQASDDLRRSFKDRGENVGAWRLACYAPLVSIAARQADSDIDSVFSAHPLLSIWYVPTRLRHLCHAHRHATAAPVASHHHHPHLPF